MGVNRNINLLSRYSLSRANDQRFPTQITPRPVFEEKKFPRPAIKDFHHLQTFLKASFALLSTKKDL